MMSLFISVAALVLVVALALATLYYGADSVLKGADKAQAARFLSEGQQLLGAADLFYADKGRWPVALDELVEEGYLRQAPSARYASTLTSAVVGAAQPSAALGQVQALSEPVGGPVTWSMPVAGEPTFVLQNVATEGSCREVNLKTYGKSAIMKKASTSYASQCYGESVLALNVIVTKTPSSLPAALPAAAVVAAPAPASDSDSLWFAPPAGEITNALTLTSGDLSFGTHPAQTTVPEKTISLVNNGTGAATGFEVTAPSGFVITANSCSGTLAIGAPCSVSVRPATSTGPASLGGALTISARLASGKPFVSLSVPLFMVWTPPRPSLTWVSGDLNFGTYVVGTVSPIKTVLLINSSSTTASNLRLAIPAGFRLHTSTCGQALAPGGDCALLIQYEFNPNLGLVSGSVEVSSQTLQGEPFNTLSIPATVTFAPYPGRIVVQSTGRTFIINPYAAPSNLTEAKDGLDAVEKDLGWTACAVGNYAYGYMNNSWNNFSTYYVVYPYKATGGCDYARETRRWVQGFPS